MPFQKIPPAYNVWASMKDRCNNPNSRASHCYGGRGITVCDRWVKSYKDFYADMGPRPDGHSIDRIDVNGNYEPGNCRWANQKTQLRRDLTGLALGGMASGAKKRERSHCKRGHEFTENNTRITPQGWRVCRQCHNAKMRRLNAAKRKSSSP